MGSNYGQRPSFPQLPNDQNVTLLHVTCYNKHLPYVHTLFWKSEFGEGKNYIVYILYI